MVLVRQKILSGFTGFREFLILFCQTVKQSFLPPIRTADILKYIKINAVDSAPVVLFCLAFAAVVTIIEASFHMKLVIKNDSLVPGFAALLILRELGAVVTALLLTSRVGAGSAAEVSLMKVTEQIDALRMLGIDPVRFLVVPRFIASVITGVVLTALANCVCLLCAMWVSQQKMGYSAQVFISAMRNFVTFQDFLLSLVKGAAFGAVIPIVSCFFGFRCQAGAEGVGLATTNSVVVTSVTIIIIDFVLSWIFTYLY